MIRLAILALLWLCPSFAARAADCMPLVTVTAQAQFDGRLLIPVTLENHPLTLMLDTGGVATTVKWDLARQLNLPVRQADRTLTGVAGKVLNFTVTGENLSLGTLRLPNLPIYVEARLMPGADGTLSSDILRRYDVGLDLTRHSLSLFAPDGCSASNAGGNVIAMEVAPNGHIRFPVKVEGKTLIATLDTGAGTSVMSMKAAMTLGIDPKSPDLSPQPGFGKFGVYSYPFQAMEIGQLAIKNPRIWIADDGFMPGADSDLVVGIDALRHMRVTIGYGLNRLYIAPDMAPVPVSVNQNR
jgi:predicted aspartyl protease